MPDKTETERYLEAAGFCGLELNTPNPPAQPSAQPIEDEGTTTEVEKFLSAFGLPKDGEG